MAGGTPVTTAFKVFDMVRVTRTFDSPSEKQFQGIEGIVHDIHLMYNGPWYTLWLKDGQLRAFHLDSLERVIE